MRADIGSLSVVASLASKRQARERAVKNLASDRVSSRIRRLAGKGLGIDDIQALLRQEEGLVVGRIHIRRIVLGRVP